MTQQTKSRVAPVALIVSSESSRAVRQARHSQNAWARHFERVESRRDEPSGIWAYLVPATGTRSPWIAYRQSAINNLLAPEPTPKPWHLILPLNLTLHYSNLTLTLSLN